MRNGGVFCEGDGYLPTAVLTNNILDGDVCICGLDNQALELAFTRPEARLILQSEAVERAFISDVAEERSARVL